MIPLYTEEEFEKSQSDDKLPLQCVICGKTYYSMKRVILRAIRGETKKHKSTYCSNMCQASHKRKEVKCENCGKITTKTLGEVKKSKTNRFFCSRSCSGTYNNRHKTKGTRRSKLENYIEIKLGEIFHNLDIKYNEKNVIGSELDVYVPSLNIAFELSGIFHYEPIFGKNKLISIQENDKHKSKACYDARIDLCVIDTSGQKYFKESTSKKYLDIIVNIINERLLTT